MSKAFVREDSDSEEEIDSPPPANEGKNYMTPQGAKRLQKELQDLKYRERPEIVKIVEWAAGNGDRSENGDYLYGKKRLREIDRRIRFLVHRLQAVEVVDPTTVTADHVLFGATVTIRDEEDREKTYSIVGVDEADATKGRISWVSPLARALMKAKVGDIVQFHAPRGSQEVEVLNVKYQALE